MNFNGLVGNDKVKNILNKTIESNKILHSYLFYGIEGIGKLEFAKKFAKAILCVKEENKPCDNCKSCIEFDANNNPDYMVIDLLEDKKEILIDQIRYLQEKIVEKPIISSKKVYIINNSDLMNDSAANCLLKTLEEPPEYAVIILIATSESRLLSTIRSRCMKTPFEAIKNNELRTYAIDNLGIELDDEKISIAQGSLQKLHGLINNQEKYEELKILINQMDKKDLIYILNNSDCIYSAKDKNIIEILDYITVILFYSKDIKKINCIKYVEDAKKSLNVYGNFDMTIDYLLLKMWEEINEKYSRG